METISKEATTTNRQPEEVLTEKKELWGEMTSLTLGVLNGLVQEEFPDFPEIVATFNTSNSSISLEFAPLTRPEQLEIPQEAMEDVLEWAQETARQLLS